MQEMHGKECEGCFLGVKLDEYSAPGARQDRRDVDMEQDTASGSSRRPERVINAIQKALEPVPKNLPLGYWFLIRVNNGSSSVSLDVVYCGHQIRCA